MSEDNKVVQRLSWTDLDTEQKNAILALTLARSVNEAARIFKTTTKRSRAYFYGRVYPIVKDIWKDMSIGLPEDALRILRGGSIAAAYELVDEVKHRDVKIRNKASNDILQHAIPRTATTAVQVNNYMPILGGVTYVPKDNGNK